MYYIMALKREGNVTAQHRVGRMMKSETAAIKTADAIPGAVVFKYPGGRPVHIGKKKDFR